VTHLEALWLDIEVGVLAVVALVKLLLRR